MLKYILMRSWRVILALVVIILFASFLFYQLEKKEYKKSDNFTFGTAVWYSLVTVSTVGYGDYAPKTTAGRIAMGFLIIFTFTNLGILMGMVNETVLEAKERRELGLDGTDFKDHIIMVGWSSIGRIVLQELIGAGQRVAVVTDNREAIPGIRDVAPRNQIFITLGDPTQEKSIHRANVAQARTVVLCEDDDTRNLILSLMIKELNPKARVIVSVQREELKRTLTSAGVTYVTSPFEMSGRLVASAAFEPEIAIFIDDITTAASGGYDLQQYTIAAGSAGDGISVEAFQTKMVQIGGSLLVAVAEWDGAKWQMKPHPAPDRTFKPRDILIVLGNAKQNQALRHFLGTEQGR